MVGCADNQGAHAINAALSTGSAEAVTAWLARAGVSARQLEAWGYGEDEAFTTNKTPEGWRNNRPVEIRLLDRAPK